MREYGSISLACGEVAPAGSAGRPTPLHEVQMAFERGHDLAARVNALAERLVGPVPEAETDKARLAGCGGVLGAAAESANVLVSHIQSAMRALDRIEGHLP